MDDMDLSLRMGPKPGPIWDLAKQTGIDTVVLNLPKTGNDEQPWEYDPLRRMQERVEDVGLSIAVIEERPPMDDIRLGRDGRDEQIENVIELIENLGRLDVPVWCWSWRTHFPVIRTGDVTVRGGSRTTAYNHTHLKARLEGDQLASTAPQISETELWTNLQYFLDRVVPVAEDAGVHLALHPDDPPINGDIVGTSRIMTSVDAFDRVLDMCPSEYNGVCLGQGNFAAMGADIPETIRHFGEKIHFVHFRDVAGSRTNFRETWHDNGPTDMQAAMEAYRDIDFDGPIRPDHFPDVTAGNGDEQLKGRLYAIGYMRGLMENV